MLTDERNGLALLMISGIVALAYQTVTIGW